MSSLRIVLCVLVFLPGLLPAAESKSEVPKLEILSPAGFGKNVKVFNEASALFFVRRKDDPRATLLRGVSFLLYRAGGGPERPSDRMGKSEDTPRWGNPPSSFALPLEERSLPVGAYRLRAKKPGWEKAEVGVVLAEFGYVDLDVMHEKSRYVASLRFRLADLTEKRSSIDLVVRVETRNGARVDGTKHQIRPTPKRRSCYESLLPLRLSSNAKPPKKGAKPPPNRNLRIVPGCRLVVFLDKTKFTWPVPLPPELKRPSCSGTSGLGKEDDRGRGR